VLDIITLLKLAEREEAVKRGVLPVSWHHLFYLERKRQRPSQGDWGEHPIAQEASWRKLPAGFGLVVVRKGGLVCRFVFLFFARSA
jgi:hypothetical protein